MAQRPWLRRGFLMRVVAIFTMIGLVKEVYDRHTLDDFARTAINTTPGLGGFQEVHTTILPRTSTKGPVTATTKGYSELHAYTKPQDVQTYNGVWQTVKGGLGVLLYSAYYDNRSGIETPMIRTIAVTSYLSDNNLLCLLWFANITRPQVKKATASEVGAWFQLQRHGLFRAIIYSCEVTAGVGQRASIPEHVSIVTHTAADPTTLLRVQVPKTLERPIAFGHCMSVAYWRQEPHRIVEWMELHRMWGVQEVTIYNNSLRAESARVYEYYVKKGFVDFRQAPNALDSPLDDEQAILLNMSPVLNDCMYRNLYRYRRLVVTDIDEMIVPRMHLNYTAMLDAIDAIVKVNYGMPKLPTIKDSYSKPTTVDPLISYMFNNVYFFSEFNITNRAPWFLTTQQYLKHVKPSPVGYSVKSIYNPRTCIGLQNHYCWVTHNLNGTAPLYVEVPQILGMNYHYKKCHFDVYLQKPGHCKKLMEESTIDYTMMTFRHKLEERVRVVLKKLNLVKPI